MAESLDALSSPHAKDPVITDSYLLTLARFGDPTAIVELWNRYYTIAYLAALDLATKKAPASEIVISSFDRWLDRTNKRTPSGTAMADWFTDIPADPPTPLRRAVLWAFYAMSGENRTIVWRSIVDQWSIDQIDAAVGTAPGSIVPVIQAEEQFGRYLTLAAATLGLPPNPDDFAPGNRRSLLISSMLGSSTEVFDEMGARIDSVDVITPPGSPQPLFTPASTGVPVGTIVRVAVIIIAAVALAVIGVVGLTRWNGTAANQPTEIISPTVTTPTPTPSPTPTPVPTPSETPQETPEESVGPESQPQPNPQTRTTSATRTTTTTNPGSQPNPNPPPPPPITSAPAGGGGDNGGTGTTGTETGGTDGTGGGDTGTGGDNETDGANGYSQGPDDDATTNPEGLVTT